MDTPPTTHSAQGCPPAQGAAAKGGIVGAHPPPARPTALAWLTAGVLALHLGALAWWLLPTRDQAPAHTATNPVRVVVAPPTNPTTAPAPTTLTAPTVGTAPNVPATSAVPTVTRAPTPPTQAATQAPRAARPAVAQSQIHTPTAAIDLKLFGGTALTSQQQLAIDSATKATTPELPAIESRLTPDHPSPPATPAAPVAESVAHPLRVPGSATLNFQVTARRKGLELPARSTLQWQVDGDSYRASLVIEAPLARNRSQTSVGSVDPVLGLQPRRFGDKNRSEVATHFDRSRTPAAIRFSTNAPDAALLPQSQDRLSVLFQLAAQVAGAPERFEAGQRTTLHTVGSREATQWVWRVVGRGALSLPAGTMDALHLVREAEGAYDNRVDVWLAPGMGYLPVRILWTQTNGDVVDQALSSHTP